MTEDLIIRNRREFSERRLEDIKDRINGIEVLKELPELCIYVTGSYGRLEASKFSDLDLFFINRGTSETSIPRLKKILLDADLIRITEEFDFPEFSKDGQFLEIHYLDDMLDNLGNSKDDYENHFTARLLLLLEGRAIHNEEFYKEVVRKLINYYFQDYPGREETFRLNFLINDIVRFWRTMCLNYEYRRRYSDENRNRVSNLKLKFSRLLICYATIILISMKRPICPEYLSYVFEQPPIDRLSLICSIEPNATGEVEDLIGQYSWFLEKTGRDNNEVLSWIGEPSNKDEAYQKGKQFGDEIYTLMKKVIDESVMRYIAV